MSASRDNNDWVRQTVSGLVLEAAENRLVDFSGHPIFDAPLVGVADGDDELFAAFRDVVSSRHLMPRETLRRHSPEGADLSEVRVIVWVLPFAEEVRWSNRGADGPSRLYSLARNNGGALNHQVRSRLSDILHARGWAAVAPVLTDGYDAFRSPAHTLTSTWSERHAAHAAGLGQFGLSGCLITPLGSNVRLGSVVTNLPLEPTPRAYAGHRAPCLELKGEGCGRCIERCPVGAISVSGIDKSKCYEFRGAVRDRHLKAYSSAMNMLPAPVVKGGERENGYSLGCALCQCGVPCEGCIPELSRARESRYA